MEKATYKLNRPQTEFFKSEEHFNCIKGTWGCGKSLVGLLKANYECESFENNLYLVIRKEYVDLRDSTLKDWNQHIGRKIISNDVRYENGSVLMFRHGDDLNALKNANLGGVLMVQAEEMTEEDFWFLNGRLRRKEGTRQLHLECNYDGKNWIYKLFSQKRVGSLTTTNTFDNEAHLPPDYIPNLKKLPKKLQERHLYGSDADMEGMVWDEFSEARHLLQPFEIPKEWQRLRVLDHGVTNPTVCLWMAVDFDGKVYVYDEHYEAGKPISEHASKINSRPKLDYDDLADPSIFSKTGSKNGQLFSVADEYRDFNLNFRPADNNVLAGLNRVNEYFKTDKLFIFKNCINAIEEVETYKWKRIKPGQEKNEPDQPVKHKDHACDAIRYGIMSRPETPEVKRKVSYEEHVKIVFDPLSEPKKQEVFFGGIEA
jgi:PBSX family phage terminase large subunit